MQPIFLIGYMGCGKSTLGRAVSALTGMRFIDLDSYIESRYGMAITEIFSAYGEDGFRQREHEMLVEVSSFSDVLVACGGGTPCFGDNIGLMNRCGLTVFLEAGVARLHQRLMQGRHKRPLIAGMDSAQLLSFICESLKKREPFYSQAGISFKSDLLDCEADKETTARRFINEVIENCNLYRK